MGKGLPKSIIKKYGITKKAWRVFRGGKSRSKGTKRSGKSGRRSNPSRSRKMGKKRGFLNLGTIFKFIRIGALVAGGVQSYQDGGGGLNGAKDAFLGYGGIGNDGRFHMHVLMRSWTPFLAASLVTHGIPKLMGIIKRL